MKIAMSDHDALPWGWLLNAKGQPVAQGSRELLEAVRDGKVKEYVRRCQAEREASPTPARKPVQLGLFE